MKKATISAAPIRQSGGYAWSWHCPADGASSKTTFPHYFECLTDAREHGYEVDPTQATGMTAPGGARYSLRGQGD